MGIETPINVFNNNKIHQVGAMASIVVHMLRLPILVRYNLLSQACNNKSLNEKYIFHSILFNYSLEYYKMR